MIAHHSLLALLCAVLFVSPATAQPEPGAAEAAAASAPAQGPSPDQRLDAVKEFRRFFRKFKEVNEKVEAVRTLEGVECAEASLELIALLDHKIPEVQKAARAVLASYRDEKTFASFIAELPEMKNQTQRAHLIEVLTNSAIRSALPVIVDIVLNDKRANDEVRFEAARAAGFLGNRENSSGMLAVLLDDSVPLVRMAAADSAGRLNARDLGPQLVVLIADGEWQVQTAAVQALGKVREVTAVEPLIALIRKGGRLEEECADALFQITGLDFGTDADGWEKTWKHLNSIPGWRIPTDGELAQKAASRKKYDAIYGKRENSTTFGGIPTTSTRILFIIDVSGSMEDLVVEREKFDAGYENYQKLTIVKTELVRTIENLDGNTLFNIVAFASDVKTWKTYLAPGNVVNKASAISWVERLKPIGGSEAQALASAGLSGSANLAAGKTNTFKALMFPFGVDPEKSGRAATPDGKEIQNKIDTVFFLSDGRPTTGKLVDIQDILAEVRTINDKFRIVFHTIAIGEFQKNFLKTLAEHNGGVFVDLGH